jgi:hypothetical protein
VKFNEAGSEYLNANAFANSDCKNRFQFQNGPDLREAFWKSKTSQIIFFHLFDSSQVFSTFAARF